MKIVILDSYAVSENDLDWTRLAKRADEGGHELVVYPRTQNEQIVARLKNAELAVCNKCNINEAVLKYLPQLRFVALTATGTDSLDIKACRRHNVPVANVPSYSTYSVAQLTLALLLDICQCPHRHEAAMRAGYWQKGVPSSFAITPQIELYGKTLGIVGYGDIGRRTAALGEALGMRVIVHTRTERGEAHFVSLASLFAQSDVISLHCPLSEHTRALVNADSIAQMKKGVILLNTARGGLVNEQELANALTAGQVGAYGADAYCSEPISAQNPLLCAPNVHLTPHIAWATKEALSRLAAEVTENCIAYMDKKERNIVN